MIINVTYIAVSQYFCLINVSKITIFIGNMFRRNAHHLPHSTWGRMGWGGMEWGGDVNVPWTMCRRQCTML